MSLKIATNKFRSFVRSRRSRLRDIGYSFDGQGFLHLDESPWKSKTQLLPGRSRIIESANGKVLAGVIVLHVSRQPEAY